MVGPQIVQVLPSMYYGWAKALRGPILPIPSPDSCIPKLMSEEKKMNFYF